MNLAELVKTSDENKSPRILLYGVQGIGKSTFGTQFKNPVFLRTEDGMKGDDFEGVARLPICESWEDVKNQMQMLLKESHEFKTLVIDSIDWLQLLIFKEIAEVKDVGDISDIGYSQGYKKAISHIRTFLALCDELYRKKAMSIVMIGHEQVVRVDPPDSEPYERYEVALHKWIAPLVYQWADMVLFVNYEVRVKSAGDNFGTTKYKGLGDGKRFMYTAERPTQKAKNRYGLPYKMPFEKGKAWSSIREHLLSKDLTKGDK